MFQKAVKHEAKLRLAIAGPSGSGKTYTALAIATAMGGPVAVVDTEHGSASKYADLFTFDVMEMRPPFHPDRFCEAIAEAAKAGYGVIILDSLTHAWNGTGGLLEIVDQAAARMKTSNTYAAWKDATPIHNHLIETIVGSDIHIIATMRSKQEYSQEKEGNKTVIKKVGMAPIQRDGMEYEFDVFLDMDIDNNAIVSKTRCPDLTNRIFPKPGADIAGILAAWLHGQPAPAMPAAQPAPATAKPNGNTPTPPAPTQDTHATDGTLRRMNQLGSQFYGAEWDTMRHDLCGWASNGRTKTSREITEQEAAKIVRGIELKIEKAKASYTTAAEAAAAELAKLAAANPQSAHAEVSA